MIIKKYKKKIILCLIILSPILTYMIDLKLIEHDVRPIFVIRTALYKDGSTKKYYGLGYQVISWRKTSSIHVDGKHVNGWLTGYEIHSILNIKDVNDGPDKELKFKKR